MRTKRETGFWKGFVLFTALMVSISAFLDFLAIAAEKEKYDLRMAFVVEVPDNDKAWGSINSMALDWAKFCL